MSFLGPKNAMGMAYRWGPVPSGCSYCNPTGWASRSADGFWVMCQPCSGRFFPPRRITTACGLCGWPVLPDTTGRLMCFGCGGDAYPDLLPPRPWKDLHQ